MFKRLTWYLIITLAITGGVALSVGFFQSLQVTSSENNIAVSKPQQAINKPASTNNIIKTKKPNTIQVVIMGDSIARGTGDDKGKGFSTYLPDYLKSQTAKELAVENIAINGLKVAGLLEQLEAEPSQINQTQDNQLAQLIASADLVLISIGGNDLRSLRSTDVTTKEEEFKVLQESYLANLREIIKVIRKNNPKTQIVFVGIYNPYEKADTAFEDNKLLSTWNYNTQQVIEADAGVIFIPTYDLFKLNTKRYLAVDGLHPNTMGYQVISQRISKAIETILN